MYKLIRSKKEGKVALFFWTFNFLGIIISTRGSADTIISFLVLLTLYLINKKQYTFAGLVYGFAIHFKIYPVILGLLICLYISKDQFIINLKVIKFAFNTLISLSSLSYYFYLKYGWTFLYESTLYHFVRTDFKHNFSPHFLFIYLSKDKQISLSDSLVLFLPSIILVILISIRFREHLIFGCYSCLIIFVHLNKIWTP